MTDRDRVEFLESVLCGLAFDYARGGQFSFIDDGQDFDGMVGLRLDTVGPFVLKVGNAMAGVGQTISMLAAALVKEGMLSGEVVVEEFAKKGLAFMDEEEVG